MLTEILNVPEDLEPDEFRDKRGFISESDVTKYNPSLEISLKFCAITLDESTNIIVASKFFNFIFRYLRVYNWQLV
jgi:hypothetical protein